MDEVREKLLSMSEAASEAGMPLAWFEELYSTADRDGDWIPWSDGRPNPLVVEWIVGQQDFGRALVVGCGLGEDAAFLDQRGWDVTAFDLSPTAIEWAKEMFSESKVNWLSADLLDLPEEWNSSFDLVLEVHILQAIPESVRMQASPKLAPLSEKEEISSASAGIRLMKRQWRGPLGHYLRHSSNPSVRAYHWKVSRFTLYQTMNPMFLDSGPSGGVRSNLQCKTSLLWAILRFRGIVSHCTCRRVLTR